MARQPVQYPTKKLYIYITVHTNTRHKKHISLIICNLVTNKLPTCRASRMCSLVWGIGPSGADTTRMPPSIWAAPVIMFCMLIILIRRIHVCKYCSIKFKAYFDIICVSWAVHMCIMSLDSLILYMRLQNQGKPKLGWKNTLRR